MKGADLFPKAWLDVAERCGCEFSDRLATLETARTVWCGEFGKAYEYSVLGLPVNLEGVGGNYIVCDQDSGGRWSPLLIEETSGLGGTFSDPHLLSWLRRYGAVALHFRVNSLAFERRAEKLDLIRRHRPPLVRRRWLGA